MKKLINALLWIRQYIFYVYHYLALAIFSIINHVFFLCKAPYALRSKTAQLNSWVTRLGIFWILWVRFEVEGKENISKVPCIYVCKHQAEWETVVMPSIISRTCYVAKKELLDMPVLGWGLKAIEYIPVDRSAGLKAFKTVISEGKNRLARNISIVIFPEGTRVAPGEHPKFHKSAMSLAKATKVPVIPIAHNAGSCWPASRTALIRPGKITLSIGEPIENTGNIDEVTETSYQWIKAKVEQLEKVSA